MKLYVGNLPSEFNDAQLRELVVPFGPPDSATVVKDRDNGRSRGFGFVELSNDDHARAAIAGLHGKNVADRLLVVNEARSKKG